MKLTQVILFSLVGIIFCFGQQKNPIGYQIGFQTSKLVAHNSRFAFVPKGIGLFIDGSIYFQTTGRKNWEKIYHFPRYGLQFKYLHLGQPKELLGEAISFYPFFDFPFGQKQKSSFSFLIGCGLAYVSKPYDIKLNPFQNAIGSYWNNLTTLQIRWNFLHNKINGFYTVLAIHHISNGAYKYPNLGLNYFSIGAGFNNLPQIRKSNDLLDTLPHTRWSFSVISGGAIKEAKIPGGPKYPIQMLGVDVGYEYKPFKSIRFGAEYEHHKLSSYFASHTEIKPSISSAWVEGLRLQIYGSHEWLVGPASIEFRMGYQILNSTLLGGYPVFNKLIFQYQIKLPKASPFFLTTGVALKTHYGVAEYIALLAGIRWQKTYH
ncbi:MAG: acyloxyacyl hydrolase [Saprospiraceae bacterium]|nr:acyloxyacyl hydrolase [Candidatus Vicinibacter affinis]MBP6171897.1 acyloxyacyl hydrolase [Saprospiraceae bacterium]MBK7301746.1 acyloxyacyl hydrolase [Candidatus Vicinibacter affinis]MBK7692885.1 acyloxyacyl hydrolase [Candidatus Vicinibacter affinis]MBK7797688.1 acyloxyacyl hydrolase [Candidatus Vicinibacter affinis]